MGGVLVEIFTQVITPVLIMIGAGVAIQKAFPLDVATLSRLNIYLFVPAFLFVRVYESEYGAGEISGIVAAVVLPALVLGVVLFALMKFKGVAASTTASVVIASVVFNAGNVGIPVAELRYGAAGGQVQALMVMVSNLSLWCVGYAIICLSHGKGWRGALGYFKLPMIYVLAAAFGLRGLEVEVPQPIMEPLSRLASGIVPVALVTLGAQLAQRARWPRLKPVTVVLLMKLAALPALTFAVCYGSNWLPWASMHLWPWPGRMIVIASAAPTAVNTLLLSIELDGDADLAADFVFWTTIGSIFTLAVVMALVDPAVT